MGLFKSKQERQIERTILIRKTLGMFAGQIKKLKTQEDGYITSARQAKQAGATQQVALAKKALKATMVQRRRLDHQMLTLKIAIQMKDQAEAHAQFAKALSSVSKSIADMFGSVDMTATQKDFELAMGKAQNMEQRVDMFLSCSNESIFGEVDDTGELVSDVEIDKLLDFEAAADDATADADIEAGLKEIQNELAKE